MLTLVSRAFPDEATNAAIERIVSQVLTAYQHLTPAEWEMLEAIIQVERKQNNIVSLFQFLEWYMADYAQAWKRLNNLERAGMVQVTRRGNGKPLAFRSTEWGREMCAQQRQPRQLPLNGV